MSDNIKIILCGSFITLMKELLEESNPLFARFTLTIHLQEFNYLEAAKFYPRLNYSDKIAFYAVFGGSPYVLTNLDYNISLEDNIEKYLINQNSILRTYIENVMLTEIRQSYDVRILELIGNGKKRYSEISSGLRTADTGLLDKQLKNLILMETVSKVFPINKKNDKKRQFYEIKDNLMRFYFSYIFGNENLISKFGENHFYKNHIEKSINTFISYRFEDIVIQYFSALARMGKKSDLLDIGSYWYDDKKNKTNGQFDCVLKDKDGYCFYEVKYYKNPMDIEECKKEEEQIKAVSEIEPKRIGFVCNAGFSFKSDEYELLDAEILYSE